MSERITNDDLSKFTNAICSCGGCGPRDEEACPACLVYHEARRARGVEAQGCGVDCRCVELDAEIARLLAVIERLLGTCEELLESVEGEWNHTKIPHDSCIQCRAHSAIAAAKSEATR